MLKHFEKVQNANEPLAQIVSNSVVYVYKTQAECARDVFEFANKLKEKTGKWIAINIENLVDGICNVSIVVHDNLVTSDLIKECIDEVPDAQDMNEYMTQEIYAYPSDWYNTGNYFDVAPHKVSNIENNYKRISYARFSDLYNL